MKCPVSSRVKDYDRYMHYKLVAPLVGMTPRNLQRAIRAKKLPGILAPVTRSRGRECMAIPAKVYFKRYGKPMPVHEEWDQWVPNILPVRQEYVHKANEVWHYPLKINDMAIVLRGIRQGNYPEHWDEFLDSLKRMAFHVSRETDPDWLALKCAAARRTLTEIIRCVFTGTAPGRMRLSPTHGVRSPKTRRVCTEGSGK